jgi:hypothetical protein
MVLTRAPLTGERGIKSLSCIVPWNSFAAHKLILRGFSRWTSIAAQVLDGPPGFTARRLSSFLLIPVGINRQGFAF